MPDASIRVVFTAQAEDDLYEIEAFWRKRGEAWRGEKYFRDLHRTAVSTLCDLVHARRGRFLNDPRNPNARSILAFGVYRIIYEIDDAAERVNIIRFWHSHRDAPPLE